GHEDALAGPGAGDRGRERELAGVVARRNRVPAESREHASAGHGITVSGDLDDPRSRREEESFAGAPADDRGEKRDLPPVVEGRDNRQRLDAEPVERTTARGRLAGDDDAANGRGLRAERSGGRQQRRQRDSDAGSEHDVRL